MDVKEFITESISQIVEATKALNEKYNSEGAKVAEGKSSSVSSVSYKHPDKIDVNFDIAVSANESESGSAGAGLKIVSLFNVGGQTESLAENQTQSRIKFTLPLTLPAIK